MMQADPKTAFMDLFQDGQEQWREVLGPAALVLHGLAAPCAKQLLKEVRLLKGAAPFRHMCTPGGQCMSVAMTNCGTYGWVSDRRGYRYAPEDPESGLAWPPMPECFLSLAASAAAEAGFSDFVPDACLINRYTPGARLSLHQDKDERDFDQPIVSVSLGIPAVFLFGGATRTAKSTRVLLNHGAVVVWGGPDRLRYHGVAPLKEGHHPAVGSQRINLTMRKAA